MRDQPPSFARPLSLLLAATFAAVGLLFLWIPDGVLKFFNKISAELGLPASPLPGRNFFLILAAAYMWTVTWLAWKMFLHPGERIFPALLVQAKLASSMISLGFFLFHGHFLIYFVNFLIDGFIGAAIALIFLRKGRGGPGGGAPAPGGEKKG